MTRRDKCMEGCLSGCLRGCGSRRRGDRNWGELRCRQRHGRLRAMVKAGPIRCEKLRDQHLGVGREDLRDAASCLFSGQINPTMAATMPGKA